MVGLRLVRSHDPKALLEAAASGFLVRADGSRDEHAVDGAEAVAGPGASRPDWFPASGEPASPFPSPDYLLVLRQGGLRDDLIRLAAERGVPGWFDPPLCLIQQLPEWLGQTDRPSCGDYERVVLLSRLLHESSGVFGRLSRPDAFVDALDRLFGELVAEGVEPADFAAALETRKDRGSFEQDRDAELAEFYHGWHETLRSGWASSTASADRVERRDGRDRLIDCARAVRSDAAALAKRLGGRRQIRIFGLQDLRGGWPVLLRALRESPALDEILLYSCVPLDELEGLRADRVEWVGSRRGGIAARLFGGAPDADSIAAGARTGETAGSRGGAESPETAGSRGAAEMEEETERVRVRMVSAPDMDREAEEIARRVRRLIESGAVPERIAVVSRSARPYTDRLLAALSLHGVPATARRRHAFPEIPVVRSVLSLFRVAADGWSRHGLVELAEQPYFGRLTEEDSAARRLDPVVLNWIGYRRRVQGLDAWVSAHEALLGEAQQFEAARDGEDAQRRGKDAPPASDRVQRALTAMEQFAVRARQLDTSRPLREWVDWLRHFLEEDPWRIGRQIYRLPSGRFDVVRIDAAGWRGMTQIVAQWHDALDALTDGGADIAVVTFESLLGQMLSGDAALWTPVRRGVHVAEALAVAQRAFDHVFIAGLSGDAFPLRAPRSPIFSSHDRADLAAAGLPVELRETWERRERELFRVLVPGARRSLTLCWARTDAGGKEVAPSAFVEEVVIAAAGSDAWAAVHEAIEKGRLEFRLGESPDEVELTFLPGSVVAPPTLPLVTSAEQRAYAAHAARIERGRQAGELTPYNGRIEDPALREWLATERLGVDSFVWSPTQLEAYAKCPWAWFSQRLLRLADHDDPDIDIDPMVRGTILHDALRRFFESAREHASEPIFLREAALEWAVPLMSRSLDNAVDDMGGAVWLGVPALRETKRAELCRMLVRYIEWEVDHNEDMYDSRKRNNPKILRTGVVQHELPFGLGTESGRGPGGGDPSAPGASPPADGAAGGEVVTLGGVRFRIRGIIDRVERGFDERIAEPEQYIAAVDYKSSVYSTPGGGESSAWTDEVVLQVPLYAHILQSQNPGSRVSRVEYRALRKGATAHSLELYQIERNRLVEQMAAIAKMNRALEAAGRYVERARAGEYPAHPAPSCTCPPFCHGWDICRVSGGPQGGWDVDGSWKLHLKAIRGRPAVDAATDDEDGS
jgi:PD-(D/E)XK nuclease superfamily